MAGRIVIIQGHPDATGEHLCHALAQAYALGALEAGHEVRHVEPARLDFPLLRSKQEWETAPLPESLKTAQEAIAWADHLVIIFPLWLGDMPALVKGFLEQVARPGFAISRSKNGAIGKKLLKGRSARVVVTMGMPALVYRWFFGAHSLKALKRNVLGFVGISPVRNTLLGMVESTNPRRRERWIERFHRMGRKSA